jgi:hypothetical protein
MLNSTKNNIYLFHLYLFRSRHHIFFNVLNSNVQKDEVTQIRIPDQRHRSAALTCLLLSIISPTTMLLKGSLLMHLKPTSPRIQGYRLRNFNQYTQPLSTDVDYFKRFKRYSKLHTCSIATIQIAMNRLIIRPQLHTLRIWANTPFSTVANLSLGLRPVSQCRME